MVAAMKRLSIIAGAVVLAGCASADTIGQTDPIWTAEYPGEGGGGGRGEAPHKGSEMEPTLQGILREAFPAYAEKQVPYQTAQASAAVYVFKDAFERANSFDKDKVRDAISATDMETFYRVDAKKGEVRAELPAPGQPYGTPIRIDDSLPAYVFRPVGLPNEWQKRQNADNITFIPDGNGAFTDGMGLLVSKDDLGFGSRSFS